MAEIAGLKLIVPSSVTNSGGTSSVSATGKVTFTSVTTSLSVNGVFDSTYDNYLIVMQYVGTGDGTVYMKMRASGSDASTNNYVQQYLIANNTSVSAGRQGPNDQWLNIPKSATARSGIHMYFYGPALAQPTAMRGVTVSGQSSAYIRDHAGTHSLSTAYDGFSLFTPYTGSLCVYGLSQ